MSEIRVGDLKCGDCVGVQGAYEKSYRIVAVARTTDTQVILADGSRWNKGNGRCRGDETWHFSRIVSEAEAVELNALIRVETARSQEINRLRNIKWSVITDDQRKRVLAILGESQS